ncbi:MAG: zinc ribbon domain-containing protein [Aquisalimonadaceae bacterium]
MPIYEYQCEVCGHELEAIQKMSDAPLSDCPDCAKPALNRKISAVGFRLKGGGWYETDFKSSGQRNLAGDKSSSGSGTSDSAKTDSAKSGTESKPAAKTGSD